MYDLTPTAELARDETVIASFHADRPTYWRDMATMAAVAMGAGMVILWAMGNPHIWTGAIGGLAAVALRASLADPRAVVAGVLAPLLAGGTVVLPGAEAAAPVAVSDDPVPEERRIALGSV